MDNTLELLNDCENVRKPVSYTHLDVYKRQGVAYVTCPRVEHRYTTSRALMMEYIDGIPIDRCV